MLTELMKSHQGCKKVLCNQWEHQQRPAEQCLLPANVIYYALRPKSQAKLLPGELTIKGQSKHTLMHWEMEGKVLACNSDHSSSCNSFERHRFHEQLCLGCLSSQACVQLGQKGSLLRPGCMGPAAGTEVLLPGRTLPCNKRGSACCKHSAFISSWDVSQTPR